MPLSELGFAAAALVIGHIAPALIFSLRPDAVERIGLNQVPVPPWVFIVVWIVIYPCLGIAAWQVLHGMPPHLTDGGRSAIFVVLLAGYLQTMSFWLTDSLRATAVLDALGVILSLSTGYVLLALVPHAAVWLLPWVTWMPVTLTIKLVVLNDSTKSAVQ